MKHVVLEYSSLACGKRAAIVSLARPPVNALNWTMIQELLATFSALEKERDVGALILASKSPKVFSAGLDLPSLLQLSRGEMRSFFLDFLHSAESLSRLPFFTATAINGACPAGGCVYACMTDFRVMKDDTTAAAASSVSRIGLNETRVGVVLPSSIHAHYAAIVGPRHADLFGLEGRMMTAREAHQVNLVDELTSSNQDVLEACLKKADSILSSVVFDAFVQSKKRIKQARVDLFKQDTSDAAVDQWINHFYSEPIQTAMRTFLQKHTTKKA